MHARTGGGTWLERPHGPNGESGLQKVQVHSPSDTGAPVPGVLSASPPWLRRMFDVRKPLEGNFGESRVGGSACYDQFMVANGSMQYSITGFAHTWDFAAGSLLVKEAGGKVMAVNPARRFEVFRAWGQDYRNDPATYGRMRKWRGLLLLGAPATVDFVAANLAPRTSGLFGKLRHLLNP